MLNKFILPIIAALALSACSVTSQSIRDAGNLSTLTVPGNYQANYRLLSDELRRCMEGGYLTASVVVRSELFTDIKKGVITPTMIGGAGNKVLVVIDVVEIDPNTTRIDIHSKRAESDNIKHVKTIMAGDPLCSK